MLRTRLYRNGVLEAAGFPVADVSEYVTDESVSIWFDLCNPTAEDLAAISEELGLHKLAVEDAIHEHQRPKLDRYDSHLFVTAYAVRLDTATDERRCGYGWHTWSNRRSVRGAICWRAGQHRPSPSERPVAVEARMAW
jgi:Mg2+ and Co2+ transporter CorA